MEYVERLAPWLPYVLRKGHKEFWRDMVCRGVLKAFGALRQEDVSTQAGINRLNGLW